MHSKQHSLVAFTGLVAAACAAPALAQDVPYIAGDVPAQYYLVDPSAAGTVRLGMFGEQLLEFNGGGTGELIANEPTTDPSITWSVQADGSLLVIPNAPLETVGVARSADCPGVVFDSVTVLDRISIRRIGATPEMDQVETVPQSTTRYIDRDPADGCAAPAPATSSSVNRRFAFRPAGELPLSASDVSGVLALQHRLGPVRPEWSAAQWSLALFDTQTGVVGAGLGIAPSFTSTLVSGRLRLDTRDANGSPIAYDYRRLQRDVRGGEGLFAVATLADGRRAVSYEYSPAQRKVALPVGLQALWFTGFSETSTDPNVMYSVDFSSEPTAAGPGLGTRWTAQFDPATGQWTYATTPFSWTRESGLEIAMQTFRTASGQIAATCPAATTCRVQSARRLLILSQFSDNDGIREPTYVRLNLLETLQSDTDGDGDLEVIDQRANFYQRALDADAAR